MKTDRVSTSMATTFYYVVPLVWAVSYFSTVSTANSQALSKHFEVTTRAESLPDPDVSEVPPAGGVEMGRYASPLVYVVDVPSGEWELVSGIYMQVDGYAKEKVIKRLLQSADAYSRELLEHDFIRRIPSNAKGRDAAYRNSWLWRGFLTVSFGIKHRDKHGLSNKDSFVRYVDGVATSVIEYRFLVEIEWEPAKNRLRVSTTPQNLRDYPSFVQERSSNWLSVSGIPLTAKLSASVKSSRLDTTINGGLVLPTFSFGTSYSYSVSREGWNAEVGLGNSVRADFLRVRVIRESPQTVRWYSLRFESRFRADVQATISESIAAISNQTCQNKKGFDVSLKVKRETLAGHFDQEVISVCTGSTRTGGATITAELSTLQGDGILSDWVITVLRTSDKVATAWTRPEFATNLFYRFSAVVNEPNLPPISLTSRGGQPKTGLQKIGRVQF